MKMNNILTTLMIFFLPDRVISVPNFTNLRNIFNTDITDETNFSRLPISNIENGKFSLSAQLENKSTLTNKQIYIFCMVKDSKYSCKIYKSIEGFNDKSKKSDDSQMKNNNYEYSRNYFSNKGVNKTVTSLNRGNFGNLLNFYENHPTMNDLYLKLNKDNSDLNLMLIALNDNLFQQIPKSKTLFRNSKNSKLWKSSIPSRLVNKIIENDQPLRLNKLSGVTKDIQLFELPYLRDYLLLKWPKNTEFKEKGKRILTNRKLKNNLIVSPQINDRKINLILKRNFNIKQPQNINNELLNEIFDSGLFQLYDINNILTELSTEHLGNMFNQYILKQKFMEIPQDVVSYVSPNIIHNINDIHNKISSSGFVLDDSQFEPYFNQLNVENLLNENNINKLKDEILMEELLKFVTDDSKFENMDSKQSRNKFIQRKIKNFIKNNVPFQFIQIIPSKNSKMNSFVISKPYIKNTTRHNGNYLKEYLFQNPVLNQFHLLNSWQHNLQKKNSIKYPLSINREFEQTQNKLTNYKHKTDSDLKYKIDDNVDNFNRLLLDDSQLEQSTNKNNYLLKQPNKIQMRNFTDNMLKRFSMDDQKYELYKFSNANKSKNLRNNQLSNEPFISYKSNIIYLTIDEINQINNYRNMILLKKLVENNKLFEPLTKQMKLPNQNIYTNKTFNKERSLLPLSNKPHLNTNQQDMIKEIENYQNNLLLNTMMLDDTQLPLFENSDNTNLNRINDNFHIKNKQKYDQNKLYRSGSLNDENYTKLMKSLLQLETNQNLNNLILNDTQFETSSNNKNSGKIQRKFSNDEIVKRFTINDHNFLLNKNLNLKNNQPFSEAIKNGANKISNNNKMTSDRLIKDEELFEPSPKQNNLLHNDVETLYKSLRFFDKQIDESNKQRIINKIRKYQNDFLLNKLIFDDSQFNLFNPINQMETNKDKLVNQVNPMLNQILIKHNTKINSDPNFSNQLKYNQNLERKIYNRFNSPLLYRFLSNNKNIKNMVQEKSFKDNYNTEIENSIFVPFSNQILQRKSKNSRLIKGLFESLPKASESIENISKQNHDYKILDEIKKYQNALLTGRTKIAPSNQHSLKNYVTPIENNFPNNQFSLQKLISTMKEKIPLQTPKINNFNDFKQNNINLKFYPKMFPLNQFSLIHKHNEMKPDESKTLNNYIDKNLQNAYKNHNQFFYPVKNEQNIPLIMQPTNIDYKTGNNLNLLNRLLSDNNVYESSEYYLNRPYQFMKLKTEDKSNKDISPLFVPKNNFINQELINNYQNEILMKKLPLERKPIFPSKDVLDINGPSIYKVSQPYKLWKIMTKGKNVNFPSIQTYKGNPNKQEINNKLNMYQSKILRNEKPFDIIQYIPEFNRNELANKIENKKNSFPYNSKYYYNKNQLSNNQKESITRKPQYMNTNINEISSLENDIVANIQQFLADNSQYETWPNKFFNLNYKSKNSKDIYPDIWKTKTFNENSLENLNSNFYSPNKNVKQEEEKTNQLNLIEFIKRLKQSNPTNFNRYNDIIKNKPSVHNWKTIKLISKLNQKSVKNSKNNHSKFINPYYFSFANQLYLNQLNKDGTPMRLLYKPVILI